MSLWCTSGRLRAKEAACCRWSLAWWAPATRCIRRASPSSRRCFNRSARPTPDSSSAGVGPATPALHALLSALRQIEHQHFRVLDAGQLQRFFGGDGCAVTLGKILAVELDAAPRNLHVGVAVGLELVLHGLALAEHRRVKIVVLADFHGAVATVRGGHQAQLAALFRFREILLVVSGLQPLLFRKHPDLV